MTPAHIAAAALVCAVAAWLALALLLRSGLAQRIALDRANARSLHQGAVPRVGGLVVIGITVVVGLLAATGLTVVAGMAGTLMLLGWADDRYGLPVSVRLTAHLISASAISVLLLPAAPVWGWLLLALALAWAMNLYNFMDGADGLAGGMAVFGFGAYAVAGFSADVFGLAVLSASAAGAAVGFLPHNLPPARLFMGDAGSVPLGFLAGALGWQGVARGLWPAWFPVLAFSPFIVDATVTLVRRLLAREAVWKAHRSHYYQRLVLGGWSHRRLALAQWAVMAAAGASALMALDGPAARQSAILVTWVLAYGAIGFAIDRRYPRSPDKHGAALRYTELHNNNRAPNAAAGRPSSRSTP